MDRDELIFRAKVGSVVAAWFAVLYGGADLLMRGANDLPSVQTPWDEMLPFWPSFALVYLSVTPFLCLPLLIIPDRTALKVLAVTLMVEIALACAIFLIFPVAPPPLPPGPHPALLRFADLINLRLNNLPSLHVALTATTFLAIRASLGWAQMPIALWAALICFSTLVTRQHDLVSFAAGLTFAAVGHWGIAPLIRRSFQGHA
jgi:PAP2 superfamily